MLDVRVPIRVGRAERSQATAAPSQGSPPTATDVLLGGGTRSQATPKVLYA